MTDTKFIQSINIRIMNKNLKEISQKLKEVLIISCSNSNSNSSNNFRLVDTRLRSIPRYSTVVQEV